MCRMMGIVAPHAVDPELLAAFRQQARGHVAPGDAPGHADGWGILYYEGGRPVHAGRSTSDAFTDPLYPAAVEEVRKARPRGVVLAHVRKASAGGRTLENTHPFALGRWAFCHNGTVFGLGAAEGRRGSEDRARGGGSAGMFGFAQEGESDSRALFEALHADLARRDDPLGAIRRLAEEVACYDHTSLTFLLTDGDALWGLRKVGNVDEERHPHPDAVDHYTLGVAKLGETAVVSQEHEFLGLAGTPWRIVPDGEVVEISRDGHVRLQRL